MRGQACRGHAEATALFSSPVVSALSSESGDPGSIPGRGKVLCSWDVREKNASSAFKLGVKTRLQNNNIIVYLRPARTIKN